MAKEHVQTKTKDAAGAAQQNMAQEQPDTRKQQVATLAPARLPYHPVYQERYGIDGLTWRALVEAIYPSAKTVEGVILAVSYCKARGLDIMKKPVHVVPIWNSALKKEVEGVWPSISELRTTAFRTGLYAGCDETEFGPITDFHFDDEVGWGEKAKRVIMDVKMPEWARVTVYRMVGGARCAFPGPKVFYVGAYGCQGKSDIPNEKWGVSGDSYMLEKCAEAASLRKAFPEETAGILTAEEMEGRKVAMAPGPTINHEPEGDAPPRPTRESTKADLDKARQEDEEVNSRFRDATADARPGRGKTIDHDPSTGEVQEPERVTDGPDKSPPSPPAETQQPAKASDKPSAQPTDYATLTRTLVEKIEATSRPKILDSMIQDYVDEIELLRTESSPGYDTVQASITKRRAYFAR